MSIGARTERELRDDYRFIEVALVRPPRETIIRPMPPAAISASAPLITRVHPGMQLSDDADIELHHDPC